MTRPARSRPPIVLVLATWAAVGLAVASLPSGARAASYPTLPVEDGRVFVGNLSAPSLTPGSAGSIGFSVGNPLSGPLDSVVLTLDLYAFNAFPGNATSTVPVAGAPILTLGAGYFGLDGPLQNVSIPSLAPGEVYRGSVGVTTSSTTPSGTFAIRTALSFDLGPNGTAYRLESRGWFTAAAWAAASELPNGSVMLNLTRLGVSGVTPETAVLVTTSDWGWILGAILAGSIALAAVAAWIYFRRSSGPGPGPGSTSGTR